MSAMYMMYITGVINEQELLNVMAFAGGCAFSLMAVGCIYYGFDYLRSLVKGKK